MKHQPGDEVTIVACAGQARDHSFDIGPWHLIALNSNCAAVGSCHVGSPQMGWLRVDLAAHPATCTLGYWHHPRFSSGTTHGDDPTDAPFWRVLSQAGVDVVLNGHEHVYERFGPQSPEGMPAAERGIREFVVGTGGVDHYPFGTPHPNSEIRDADTFGILKFILHPTSYAWEFVPEAGKTFRDAGSATCH
jgi:hypothetical protein